MSGARDAAQFLELFETAILFPLMALMFSAAVLVFLWGGFEYVNSADSDDGRTRGQRHMMYGIIGLVIMVSAYAIIEIATNTFGCDLGPEGCPSETLGN